MSAPKEKVRKKKTQITLSYNFLFLHCGKNIFKVGTAARKMWMGTLYPRNSIREEKAPA